MTRTLPLLATLGAAAALSSCAPTAEPGPETLVGLQTDKQCFFTRSVNGFSEAPDSPAGNDRVFVSTGVRERFVLEAFGPCPDVDFAYQIGLDANYGPSLCTGDTAELLVPSAGRVDKCLVRVVGRIEGR